MANGTDPKMTTPEADLCQAKNHILRAATFYYGVIGIPPYVWQVLKILDSLPETMNQDIADRKVQAQPDMFAKQPFPSTETEVEKMLRRPPVNPPSPLPVSMPPAAPVPAAPAPWATGPAARSKPLPPVEEKLPIGAPDYTKFEESESISEEDRKAIEAGLRA